MDHLNRGTLNLDEVEVVVLDEADEMISMGFKEDLQFALGTSGTIATMHGIFTDVVAEKSADGARCGLLRIGRTLGVGTSVVQRVLGQ